MEIRCSRKSRLMVSKKIVVIVYFLAMLLSCTSQGQKDEKAGSDLSKHPVYKDYPFGKSDEVIDFATQPLAVPTGVVAELLQRDRVLAAELESQGLELRFHSFFSGTDINYFLKRGDLDVAVSGDMPTLQAAAEYDIIISAIVKQNFTCMVADDFLLLQDIKGKRIGCPLGTSAHYSLLKALDYVQLDEKDIIIKPMDIDRLPEALAKGEIDAFVAWEPVPTIALTRYPHFKIIYRNLSTSFLVFSKKLYERHPRAVYLINAALVRGMRWMCLSEENLLQAAQWSIAVADRFSGKKIQLSLPQMAQILVGGLLSITDSPLIPLSILRQGGNLEETFLFLKNLDKIPDHITWEKIYQTFDQQIIKTIISQPLQYKLDLFDYQVELK